MYHSLVHVLLQLHVPTPSIHESVHKRFIIIIIPLKGGTSGTQENQYVKSPLHTDL